MFEQLVNEVRNRFNLGEKALPLSQELVVVIDNPKTYGFIGFIDRFKNNGLGYLIDSWLVSTAPLSINHVQITEILETEELETLSVKTGLDKGTLLLALAYLLPHMIRKLAFEPTELNVEQSTPVTVVIEEPVKSVHCLNESFQELIQTVANRFNIGTQASSLVQTLVTSINQEGQAAFVGRFKQRGLERLIDSWIGSSAPLTINHAQLEEVLGETGGLLTRLQTEVGLDKGTALLSLAYLLPNLIKQLADANEPDSVAVSKPKPIPNDIPVSEITPNQTVVKAAAPQVLLVSPLVALIEDIAQHFNLGQKASLLVQVLVAVSTNSDVGGFEALKTRFIDNGLEELVDSWVSNAPPLAINQVQIEEIFGGDGGLLDIIVNRVGIDKGYALMGLAYALPTVFNQLAQLDIGNASLTSEVNTLAAQGKQLLGDAYHSASFAAINAVISSPVTNGAPAEVAASPARKTTMPESPIVEQINSESQASGGVTKYLLWLAAIGTAVVVFQSLLKVPDQPVSNEPVEQVENKSVAPEVATPAPAKPTEPQFVAKSPETEQGAPTSEAALGLPNEPPKSIAPTLPPEQPVTPVPQAATVSVEPPKPVDSAPVQPAQVTPPVVEAAAVTPVPAPSSEAAVPVPAATASPVLNAPNAKLYFDFGKSDLSTAAEQQLTPVVEYVKANPEAKISIVGIYDPQTKKSNSTYAAKNRTQNIQTKLLAAGVAKERITIEAFQPNREGAKEARRVEIKVSQ